MPLSAGQEIGVADDVTVVVATAVVGVTTTVSEELRTVVTPVTITVAGPVLAVTVTLMVDGGWVTTTVDGYTG